MLFAHDSSLSMFIGLLLREMCTHYMSSWHAATKSRGFMHTNVCRLDPRAVRALTEAPAAIALYALESAAPYLEFRASIHHPVGKPSAYVLGQLRTARRVYEDSEDAAWRAASAAGQHFLEEGFAADWLERQRGDFQYQQVDPRFVEWRGRQATRKMKRGGSQYRPHSVTPAAASPDRQQQAAVPQARSLLTAHKPRAHKDVCSLQSQLADQSAPGSSSLHSTTETLPGHSVSQTDMLPQDLRTLLQDIVDDSQGSLALEDFDSGICQQLASRPQAQAHCVLNSMLAMAPCLDAGTLAAEVEELCSVCAG